MRHHPTFHYARMAFFLAAALAPAAHAAGTAAGTSIVNTASVSYTDPGGTPTTVPSNTSTIAVDEILDVTVVANNAGNLPVNTPASNQVLSFTVTNTGNGPETFELSFDAAVAGDNFNPANVRIYIDTDGNGAFDPLVDTLYVAGTNDPALTGSGAATDSVVVFLVSDIPSSLTDGNIGLVRITAEALTAQGTPGSDVAGTVFAGSGQGGTDAVVGSTTAEAVVQNGYIVRQVAATFTKSAVVLDQFGGSNPIPGATITYTLTFTATGTGTLTNVKLEDTIPSGTTYQAGTIELDTVGLTDIAADDEGFFSGTKVEVIPSSGSVTAPATHVVTFDVKINN